MKPIIPTEEFITREKINKGDVVRILWKKYVRKARAKEEIFGVASETKRKRQKIKIFKPLPGLLWETKINKDN